MPLYKWAFFLLTHNRFYQRLFILCTWDRKFPGMYKETHQIIYYGTEFWVDEWIISGTTNQLYFHTHVINRKYQFAPNRYQCKQTSYQHSAIMFKNNYHTKESIPICFSHITLILVWKINVAQYAPCVIMIVWLKCFIIMLVNTEPFNKVTLIFVNLQKRFIFHS